MPANALRSTTSACCAAGPRRTSFADNPDLPRRAPAYGGLTDRALLQEYCRWAEHWRLTGQARSSAATATTQTATLATALARFKVPEYILFLDPGEWLARRLPRAGSGRQSSRAPSPIVREDRAIGMSASEDGQHADGRRHHPRSTAGLLTFMTVQGGALPFDVGRVLAARS